MTLRQYLNEFIINVGVGLETVPLLAAWSLGNQ